MNTISHIITYLCPQCNIRINRQVNYPNPDLFINIKLAKMTILHWCPKCEARNELTFSIVKLKDRTYRISTHSFKSNDKPLNRRLRLELNKKLKLELTPGGNDGT